MIVPEGWKLTYAVYFNGVTGNKGWFVTLESGPVRRHSKGMHDRNAVGAETLQEAIDQAVEEV